LLTNRLPEVIRDLNNQIAGVAKGGSLYRVDRDEVGQLRGLAPLPVIGQEP
jgi:hypothetical protein